MSAKFNYRIPDWQAGACLTQVGAERQRGEEEAKRQFSSIAYDRAPRIFKALWDFAGYQRAIDNSHVHDEKTECQEEHAYCSPIYCVNLQRKSEERFLSPGSGV